MQQLIELSKAFDYPLLNKYGDVSSTALRNYYIAGIEIVNTIRKLMAKEDFTMEEYSKKIDAQPIIEMCMNYFAVSEADFMSNRRFRNLVNCRLVCAYLLRNNTNLSYNDIGQIFGGRHHSTIIYYDQSCRDFLSFDNEISSAIIELDLKIEKVKNDA
jgi:chromosomal replication initiator protein